MHPISFPGAGSDGTKLSYMKTETILLGSLGLAESFTLLKRKTVYKTIDHRPSLANVTYGTRHCFNTRTGKAEKKKCNEKVSRGT
jgi:hypothetical protein